MSGIGWDQFVAWRKRSVGTAQGEHVAVPAPAGGLRQRRQQIVVAAAARRVARPVGFCSGHDRYRTVDHHDLTLHAVAPEIDLRLAVAADGHDRHALGALHGLGVEQQFAIEGERALGGEAGRADDEDRGQSRHTTGNAATMTHARHSDRRC
jgi:hypothetical protein